MRAGGRRIREREAAGIGIAIARAEIGARENPNIKEGIRDNIDLYLIEMSRITITIMYLHVYSRASDL